MYNLSQYAYVASFVALALAAVMYASYGVARRRTVLVGAGDGGDVDVELPVGGASQLS
jgi:hypothetical protein